MKVILDNNAFIHLAEDPELKTLRDAFLSRIGDESIMHVGTFEFIEELFLLHQHRPQTYFQVLKEYWKSVQGRFLFPWNTLIQLEIENRRSLATQEKYLERSDTTKLQRLVFSPDSNAELSQQILLRKDNFERQMNEALREMIEELRSRGHSPKEIRLGFKAWYESIESFLQSWLESAFSIQGVSYTDLPHTSAFLKFVMCRQHEVIASSTCHKGNDLYDRGYYVSAAETGLLVTDDKGLLSTCSFIGSDNIEAMTLLAFLS